MRLLLMVCGLLMATPTRAEPTNTKSGEEPMQLVVDLSVGRSGFGSLDDWSCDWPDQEGGCLNADGVGTQLGLGWLQRMGHFRWGVGVEATVTPGGEATSVQSGLTLHLGLTSRYLELLLGTGVGVMWITNRRDHAHTDLAIPLRLTVGLRITRSLALAPQAGVYFGNRAIGAFIGGGVQWTPPTVLDAAEQALRAAFGSPENVPDGMELRTDHGPQYTGSDCGSMCRRWHVEHTFAPVGRPTGNAVAERLIRTLKEEVIWLRDWDTAEQLREAVAAWVIRYNEHRPHQALGYKTPSEYRAEHLATPLRLAA